MKYKEHNVGGHVHGGSEKESVKGGFECVTSYPLDTSDHNGGDKERCPDVPVAMSGAAGGYRGSTEGGGGRKRAGRGSRAGIGGGNGGY